MTVREVAKNDIYRSSYGQLTFSGAYVYSMNTADGFKLRGKISHHTAQDMIKSGDYTDWNKEISRILYANKSLITTSNARLEAHTADTVRFINGIDIPGEY
ncbi:beta-propeller domain-containing protein [Paenibacillus sp.]|uniref:beta-propeller domain-containing protein n=1 Tax=Paenibacillus sp. TaxID=58172 RepID=UPI0035CD060A